jgi:hypothetical protein
MRDAFDRSIGERKTAEQLYNEAQEERRRKYRGDNAAAPPSTEALEEWDAGDDPGFIPPREWLLANQFCRAFISSIVAAGGAGKSANAFNINPDDRHAYIRLDPAKVNITRHASAATWFHIVGVPIGNATKEYPAGDTIQVVVPWSPPDTWVGVSTDTLNAILSEIDVGLRGDDGAPDGRRYSSAPSAKDKRAAWKIVQEYCPEKSEAQCREIIRTWEDNGVLVSKPYNDPGQRKERQGLYVDNAKRPGTKVAP